MNKALLDTDILSEVGKAIDPTVTSFTVTALSTDPAVTDLGLLPSMGSDSADLSITTRDSVVSLVTLDGATTLGQVIEKIVQQTVVVAK